jgi:bifunctional UDP-N-acetylglucosamine pyrophosphorylase / glucosamine-1-phosphate N-acetyltransferase
MKTLLLVAGRSRRFWPLSEKALFPICGKPLLSHVIDRLREAGCADIIVVGGKHNLEEVRRLFPQLQTIEQEQLELGMRGALLSALPQIPGEDILLVSSNDVIEASAYRATVEAGKKTDGALLAQRVTTYFPGGYLSTDGRSHHGHHRKTRHRKRTE